MEWKKYLKFAAFIPAIVLVGTFVGCQTGTFQMFTKPELKPQAQPASTPQPSANPTPTPPKPEKPPVFFGGTKSMPMTGITQGLTPAGTHAPELDVPMRKEFSEPPIPPQAIPNSPSAPK